MGSEILGVLNSEWPAALRTCGISDEAGRLAVYPSLEEEEQTLTFNSMLPAARAQQMLLPHAGVSHSDSGSDLEERGRDRRSMSMQDERKAVPIVPKTVPIDQTRLVNAGEFMFS